MKKGIWWLFGGIGLSAIVFAVLLATNVVSLHDNSSNDNSNNNLVSNEEDICRLNKKVDGVEYLFLVSKLEDLYYLNVYYIGDRAEGLLYRTDIEYSGECNEELTEYVSRKLINSDEEYNYYLYRYPTGPSFRLVLVASHKKYEYMYNMLELGYDHNDLVTKVQSGKKDYVLSEIVELDGNARISMVSFILLMIERKVAQLILLIVMKLVFMKSMYLNLEMVHLLNKKVATYIFLHKKNVKKSEKLISLF